MDLNFPSDTPFFKNQILKDFLKNINQEEANFFLLNQIILDTIYLVLWSIDLIDKLERRFR